MAHETTVTVTADGKGKFTQSVTAGSHTWTADEPQSMGGLDDGPAPYDMLLGALGACTAMTLRMYADQKKWDLQGVSVTLTHRKEKRADNTVADVITRDISVTGALDDAQRQRLLEIANKCPVHRTLENRPEITSRLVNDAREPSAKPTSQKPPQP